MRQKKFPCCGEPMTDLDLYSLIEETGTSCPTIQCPHCSRLLTLYLNIDSVEVQDE